MLQIKISSFFYRIIAAAGRGRGSLTAAGHRLRSWPQPESLKIKS